MNIIFTLVLLAVVAMAWIFYDRFTKRGAVSLKAAWRSYTVWLSMLGAALGGWIVDLLRYFADAWEPLRAQFGDLLHADSAGMALQLLSGIFLMFRLKGQGLPGLNLPSLPAADDKAAG